MKIESVIIQNFRCFGPEKTKFDLENAVTTFVGGNGSGKTAAFQAISRLFGVTTAQRTVRRRDFHLPADQKELRSGAGLHIEIILTFPELEGLEEQAVEDAVPEYFLQMSASGPGEPLKARIALRATWTDDDTPDGAIDEDIRWITTLDEEYNWEDCKRVQAVERTSIQLVYVPATRDAITQVTSFLKGRLWKAAKWSEKFRDRCVRASDLIQKSFEREEPATYVLSRLSNRWNQVHEADTDTTPVLRLVENRFEELVRKAEFAFYPDEAGRERDLVDLSDGQQSLFHIALTAATLEVEKDAFSLPASESLFDHEKLRRTHLTLLAIEEPENSLSPFFLSRIMAQARDIGAFSTAQVVLSSHSPAILSRVEPEEVRYFRWDRGTRCSLISKLTLPVDDLEASQYVRLAVKAYPELYFARFVILAEGDSERLVIPRISDAMGMSLDPSFVPIVPIGGRFAKRFWVLLNDLQIPHATLLDLDLGRKHGGSNSIKQTLSSLAEVGNDLRDNFYVRSNIIDPARVEDLEENMLLNGNRDNDWLQALEQEGVFFSYPLDIDFSMLRAFPGAYQRPNPGGRGPRSGDEAIREKKAVTLKTDGLPALYDNTFDEVFQWYPYLFLNRSKPETHLKALTYIEMQDLNDHSPLELKSLIEYVKNSIDPRVEDE